MKWQILVLLMFLAACAKPAMEQKVEETAPEPMTTEDITDITMAMQLGKPVKCVSESEGQTATIYMKGSKMRMDTMPADAHGIYTEDTMYTWKDKQGMMMKMEDVKRMAAQTGQPVRPKTQEEIVANAKQTNAKCESASVDESMFTPPADVQFQDLSDMIKQAEAAAKGMQK